MGTPLRATSLMLSPDVRRFGGMATKRRRGDEQDDAIEAQFDQWPGMWTQLQLIDMDVASCGAGRREAAPRCSRK
jgi:hypothetical protein